MRTSVKIYEVYQLHELSLLAQEKAYENWRTLFYYAYSEENEKSLTEFSKLFSIKVKGCEYYEGWYTYRNIDLLNESYERTTGVRLATYIQNNFGDYLFKNKIYYKGKSKRISKVICSNECVLTGYYIDEVILKPIYEFIKAPTKETTFMDLMKTCVNSYLSACSDDVKNCLSLESFKDNDELEYLKDGAVFYE